jgi:methenyltetrahydromethanopterin cyclohydrolase
VVAEPIGELVVRRRRCGVEVGGAIEAGPGLAVIEVGGLAARGGDVLCERIACGHVDAGALLGQPCLGPEEVERQTELIVVP